MAETTVPRYRRHRVVPHRWFGHAVVSSLVWLTSRRDLAWRRRRFVIAVGAITLVLALTLLLSGFRDGIDVETARTVKALGGDAFVVRDGVSGPFTTVSQLGDDVAEVVARAPGVRRADPIVSVRHAIESAPVTDVYLIGTRPGGLGIPAVHRGRAPQATGEAVLDSRAGREIGDRVRVGGRDFAVVGLVDGVSVWAGLPTMFVTLADAQALVFGGTPAATAVVATGRPRSLPEGLRVVDLDQAKADLKRPLANAITTIDLLRFFLWLVAAAIVGSVLYVSALERSRDFAVFKAFGTDSADLVGTLIVQAFVLSAVAAGLAAVVSRLLSGLFPSVISFPARTLVVLPLVALAVGLVGSLAGARRAIVVDPASAFGGP
ncbi:MAG: ABC transporter permease [Actinomycetota bacterium]|nr:ABC transporter permease [Actinomycetota bacterium]